MGRHSAPVIKEPGPSNLGIWLMCGAVSFIAFLYFAGPVDFSSTPPEAPSVQVPVVSSPTTTPGGTNHTTPSSPTSLRTSQGDVKLSPTTSTSPSTSVPPRLVDQGSEPTTGPRSHTGEGSHDK